MKVYISGKITGLPFEAVQKAFTAAEKALQIQGHTTANPLLNGLDASADWAAHMVADIKMLLDCDCIYMLNGWRDSRGAKIEHHIAEALGMGVMYQKKKETIYVCPTCESQLPVGLNNVLVAVFCRTCNKSMRVSELNVKEINV